MIVVSVSYDIIAVMSKTFNFSQMQLDKICYTILIAIWLIGLSDTRAIWALILDLLWWLIWFDLLKFFNAIRAKIFSTTFFQNLKSV